MSSSSPQRSPIEYVRETDPARPPGRGSRLGWLWSLLAIGGLIGAFVGLNLIGPVVRAAILGAACDASMCSQAGMTAAGWALVTVPLALAASCAAYLGKLPKAGRIALVAVTLVVAAVAVTFVPGRRRSMDDLVQGPGADQFINGVVWALGGGAVALVLLFLLVFAAKRVPWLERRYNPVAAVVVGVVLAASLPVGVANADPTWLRAAEIFPERLEMNGDVLTRTSIADRRGCAGLLPDDALLARENCIMTVLATFTTDDSDAVVTFRAVLYMTFDAAVAVKDGVPDGAGLVGAPTESITVVSRTHSWVLVGNAAHADGRAITADERSWVLWPLRQVSYHFIGAQAGIFIDPDPKDDIRPRTP